MSDNILIVENNQDVAERITICMQDLGLKVTHCNNGEDGVEQAIKEDYSLMIVDFNLPDYTGVDVCHYVKAIKTEQAILVMTISDSEIDHVLGLERGADDFIAKPLNARELQARVNTLLQRVQLLKNTRQQEEVNKNSIILHGQLMINKSTHEVVLRDQVLTLTSTEFDLLSFMAQNPNQVFSRAHLLDKVWGYQHSGYEHTVNSHINRLRNKLIAGQPNSINRVFPAIIQTVFGVGYKFSLEGVM